MLKQIFGASVLALGLYAANPALATFNLIQNPGFETGDFTDWTTNNFELTQGFNQNFVGAYSPFEGNYAAIFGQEVAPLATISQTFTTVPGDTYDINFWLAFDTGALSDTDPNFPPQGASEYTASFDGTTLTDVNTNGLAPFNYTDFNFQQTATSTSSDLTLGFLNYPDLFYLDNVSVTDVSAVPEPTTPVILIVGGLVIAGLMLRRRAIVR